MAVLVGGQLRACLHDVAHRLAEPQALNKCKFVCMRRVLQQLTDAIPRARHGLLVVAGLEQLLDRRDDVVLRGS
eukprot:9417593-Pyramimonas_sp.AAC.1